MFIIFSICPAPLATTPHGNILGLPSRYRNKELFESVINTAPTDDGHHPHQMAQQEKKCCYLLYGGEENTPISFSVGGLPSMTINHPCTVSMAAGT